MVLENLEPDEVILRQIGQRLARRRIDLGLTQELLAERAGLGKRTVERIESGESAQLSSLLRILRVLELLPRLDLLLPELGPRPMDLLRRKGKERQRASTRRGSTGESSSWTWDDEQ
jgi:transcriptional regulator with XRE-family HTH domain